MKDADRLYSFVFRGLLAREALDKTEAKSKHAASNQLVKEIASRLSLDLLEQELVAKASEMATVYTAIAAFENYTRDFITKIMLEVVGENWWNEKVSEKIRSKAENRKAEEEKVKYHTQRGVAPIYFTDFDELASIISQNWSLFEDYLLSQEWVRQIFTTLTRSRNVIMHSGELGKEDIERLGTNIRDWIKQVGS